MDLEGKIVAATREVFETMVLQETNPGDPLPRETVIACNLSGLLGLAGDLRGSLALHWPLRVANDITGRLLGAPDDYPENEIADATAEMINMIAGGIKTAFGSEGKALELSVPTTVSGRSFAVRSSRSAAHLVVPFQVEAGAFWVELKFLENPG